MTACLLAFSEQVSSRFGSKLFTRGVKPLLFVLCLSPFLLLVWDIIGQQLGANPVEAVTHRTGDWVLRFLLLTLAVSPVRRLSGWGWPLRLRRMLGLYAFFYLLLHFSTWLVLDHALVWSEIAADIPKRLYVTVGLAGLVLMIPLALTSTRGMMRRLGRNWQRLHRSVYLVALLAVAHYLWLVKADYLEPLVYAAVLLSLLALRLPLRSRMQRRQMGSGNSGRPG